MAPSRGEALASSATHHASDDKAVVQQSESALRNAKRNFGFMINPTTASDKPTRLRTRALLRTLRYVGQFIFWRLVRWAKYAAVGAAIATLSATAIGTFISGAGFVLAPTGIMGSVLAASVWGVGKYIARKAHKRWAASGGDVGIEARERVSDGDVRDRSLNDGIEMGASAIPW